MKAAVRMRYGPPEVVRIADVETPTPGAHEVLVEVHAATVNRTDCGFRAAKPWIVRFFSGLLKPKVTVLGQEDGIDFPEAIYEVGGASTRDQSLMRHHGREYGYIISGSTLGIQIAFQEYESIPPTRLVWGSSLGSSRFRPATRSCSGTWRSQARRNN